MVKDNMHKNLLKFSHAVYKLCEQTDRQTDILVTICYMTHIIKNKLLQSEPGIKYENKTIIDTRLCPSLMLLPGKST